MTLTKLAQDPTASARASALEALSDLASLGTQKNQTLSQALSLLEGALQDKETVVRSAGAEGIAKLAEAGAPSTSKVAVKQLFDLLHDPKSEVRANAAKALGNLQPDPTQLLPQLTQLLNDTDQVVRMYSVEAIGKMGAAAQSMVPKLRSMLKNQDQSLVPDSEIAEALGRIGSAAKPAVPELWALFKEQGYRDLSVAQALLAIGVEGDVTAPELVEILQMPGFVANLFATQALLQMSPESLAPLPEPLLSILQARISSEPQWDTGLKENAIEVLFRPEADLTGDRAFPRDLPDAIPDAQIDLYVARINQCIVLINHGLQSPEFGARLVSAIFLATIVESRQLSETKPPISQKFVQAAAQQLAKADVKTAIATLDDTLKGFEDGRYKQVEWKGNVARLLTALKQLRDSRAQLPPSSP